MAVGMTVMRLATLVSETDTEFNPDKVTPGPEGFIMTALFAAAVLLLGFLLVRRIRRNQYRSEVRDDIATELAERDGGGAGPAVGAGYADPSAGTGTESGVPTDTLPEPESGSAAKPDAP